MYEKTLRYISVSYYQKPHTYTISTSIMLKSLRIIKIIIKISFKCGKVIFIFYINYIS